MDKIIEYMKRRASSTILVSYAVFWAIFHWEGLYTTFFVSQEYIYEKFNGLMKNEYVREYFFEFHIDDPCHWIRLIAPFILAYLYVWWLPKFISNPSYEKELEYKYERKQMKARKERELADYEAKTIKKQAKVEDEKLGLAQKKAETAKIDPKIEWAEEFNNYVMRDKNLDYLKLLKQTIYKYKGSVPGGRNGYNGDSIMSWDVNELAEVSTVYGDTHATLTEKGKFFLKKYSEL